jgi:hypothetical protein
LRLDFFFAVVFFAAVFPVDELFPAVEVAISFLHTGQMMESS